MYPGNSWCVQSHWRKDLLSWTFNVFINQTIDKSEAADNTFFFLDATLKKYMNMNLLSAIALLWRPDWNTPLQTSNYPAAPGAGHER